MSRTTDGAIDRLNQDRERLIHAITAAGFAHDSDPAEVIRVLRETLTEREEQILDLRIRIQWSIDQGKQ